MSNLGHWVPEEKEFVDISRHWLALLAFYLNKEDARDGICRAIQYGSKCISAGEAGVAQKVDRSTTLARKVFRLLKFVDQLHNLSTPPARDTRLPVIFLQKSKSSLMAAFLALDNVVWAGWTGIYKNKEHTELIWKMSLYCYLGGCTCSSFLEFYELLRPVFEKEGGRSLKLSEEQRKCLLNLARSSMDIIVAVGLLQLAPKKITTRVTGAFGFVTSLISCYQLLGSSPSK